MVKGAREFIKPTMPKKEEHMQPENSVDNKNMPIMGTSTGTDMETDMGMHTEPKPVTDTDTVTLTGTSTGTLLDTYIKPSDVMVRKVCYVTDSQAKYVEKMAKKYKAKESEIFRIALDLLMKK